MAAPLAVGLLGLGLLADSQAAVLSTGAPQGASLAISSAAAAADDVGGTKLQHARTMSYPLEQAWPSALRYLRVDRGFSLVDRDREAGFILFDFPVGSGSGRGAVEMFVTEDMSGRPSVRVVVSTHAGPSHLPHAIAEGLATKLREEHGPPAAPPGAEPDTPAPPPGPEPGAPPLVEGPVDPQDL